jgi:flagellar motor component MotA
MSTSDFALSVAASVLAVIVWKLAGVTGLFLCNIVRNVLQNLARVLETTKRITFQLMHNFREVMERSLAEAMTHLSGQDYIITLNLAPIRGASPQDIRANMAAPLISHTELQQCLANAMTTLAVSIYLSTRSRIRLPCARVRIVHS